jgi:ATP-dependent DNA ligase
LEHDDWWAEQKMDGHRVAVFLTPSDPPFCFNRSGVSRSTPRFLWGLRSEQSLLLDGELIENRYFAFDVPTSPGVLYERRAVLEKIVFPGVDVVPAAKSTSAKRKLLKRALREGSEGIVLKNKNSYYEGDRSRNWLKVKLVKELDAIVMDISPDGRDNAVLVLLDIAAGKPVEICTVSTFGKGPIQIGSICTVRYLYATADRKLVQPRIIRFRTDKSYQECTTEQLILSNSKRFLTP